MTFCKGMQLFMSNVMTKNNNSNKDCYKVLLRTEGTNLPSVDYVYSRHTQVCPGVHRTGGGHRLKRMLSHAGFEPDFGSETVRSDELVVTPAVPDPVGAAEPLNNAEGDTRVAHAGLSSPLDEQGV
eukprot:5015438-Amphidinium_carterae.1